MIKHVTTVNIGYDNKAINEIFLLGLQSDSLSYYLLPMNRPTYGGAYRSLARPGRK